MERYCGEFEELKATVVPVVTHSFSTDDMKGNDEWVSFYTGLHSYVSSILPILITCIRELELLLQCKCTGGEERLMW